MGNHKKAASCTALPSFYSTFTPLSEKNNIQDPTYILADKLAEVSLHKKNRPHRSQSFYLSSNNQFPLPSFCLYSRAALSNEYASDSDIIQFISPQSKIMEERLPMFVGVLHSLFVAVNDLSFDSDSDNDDNEEEDDDDDDDEGIIKGDGIKHCIRGDCCNNVTERGQIDEGEEKEQQEEEDHHNIHEERTWIKKEKNYASPFTIIGLSTMKIITCNLVETEQRQDISKELGLAIMVPVHFSDNTINYYTEMLYNSITKSNLLSNSSAKDIGEQIAPMIHYWFSQFHGDKIISKKKKSLK